MAKKGGVQQLQADIQTDEEFDRFIERPGLIVCDIYSEWCGPCLGMVGSLKKIKLELGGDNLSLAICKSDTISYVQRFNKKSEPTWLFIVEKQAVNLMFGTNVPKLMKMITHELAHLTSKHIRQTYAITELQPEEQQRKKVIDNAAAEALRIETAEKDKKRRAYLHQVTESILENLGDIGVSVFGPQVSRDMFKKINEPAEHLKLQCKDRKYAAVSAEHFDLVNLVCTNHLPQDVIEQLDQRELLICFWKMPEDTRRSVVDMMNIFAHHLVSGRVDPPEAPGSKGVEHPPVIAPMDILLEIELDEYEEPEPEPEPVKEKSIAMSEDMDLMQMDMAGENAEEGIDTLGDGLDLGLDFDMDGLMGDEELNLDKIVEDEPPQLKKRIEIKTITMPPVWVPNTHRAHAALVYAFFRNQTQSFLPPDPVPEPPHVIMAFDAYKKKDLLEIYERHRADVPVFGFFTSDDVAEAKLIAPTIAHYATKVPNPTDKIIFRINKTTSNTMLAFAPFGPSYVSGNTVVGKEEASKLFPENYGIIQETKEDESAKKKKKKEKEKGKKDDKKEDKKDSATGRSSTPPEEGVQSTEGPSTETGTPTTSGEENADSMQQTAAAPTDGENTLPEGQTAPPVGEAAATAAPESAPSEATAETPASAPAEATAPETTETAPPPPTEAEAKAPLEPEAAAAP